jgi:hypothetical protein
MFMNEASSVIHISVNTQPQVFSGCVLCDVLKIVFLHDQMPEFCSTVLWQWFNFAGNLAKILTGTSNN